ncbi:hypothetical protein WME89_01670 [Sorangium sp. So ce321]|uniref:hypothetical protein n=1 Tax=Sorangium sp. So ce321 TaxID=3133300 RepID=UPI003F5DA329
MDVRVAVIRVSGRRFEVDAYLRRHGFAPDAVWHAGDRTGRGQTLEKSGFSLCIGDAASADALVQEFRAWVRSNRSALLELRQHGAAAEVDVAMTVGSSAQFTASIALAPEDLALLAEVGLSYRISAYPCDDSDDEDTDEETTKAGTSEGGPLE